MTSVKVGQKIATARKDAIVTAKEAKTIIAAAEKNKAGKADKVNNSEAKKIGEFFEAGRGNGGGGGDGRIGRNPPALANPHNPLIEAEAKKAFNQFFIKHKLPYGENEPSMKFKMTQIISQHSLGDLLPKPPSTRNLHEVPLHDNRMVDGDRQVAFYDAEKNKFFVRADGGFRGNPGNVEKWYGPFDMNAPLHPLNPPRPR